MSERIALGWQPRAEPLVAVAVAATGAAAVALGRRLAALGEHDLAAVAGDDLLLVLGAALPWVDGVVYLGRDPAAPELLLPTALAPTIPAAILERAVRSRIARGPVAVLASPPRLVPCGAARAIDREQLAAWIDRVRQPDVVRRP